ncbi:hypothetical protein AB0D14_43615 [Streptomyces sp. NPDC048484]|uniref:hypothetical protein n=1 Tax=Streptomyces sp. NPDC048484 TaxID=3155146 RepID=UPI00344916FC
MRSTRSRGSVSARREELLDEAGARMRTVLEWHRQVGLDGANALILAGLRFIAEPRGDARGAPAHHEEGYRIHSQCIGLQPGGEANLMVATRNVAVSFRRSRTALRGQ